MNISNRNLVSRFLGVRKAAKNPNSLFAAETSPGSGKESVFTFLALSGVSGGLSGGSVGGYGSKTHAVIRNALTGRKSTVLLSTLVDRNIRYVGPVDAVLQYFVR
jgi:hypothetical protein